MIADIDLNTLSLAEKRRILNLYLQQEKWEKYNQVDKYYATPEDRDDYGKHMEFFKAGLNYKERLILAANRTGKSLSSCYELVCHATGNYPDWWEGRRLKEAQDWWVCGENNNLLRDSIIETLLGKVGEFGTGLFRQSDLVLESITDTTKTSTTISSFLVKHKSGKVVKISFKTYEMGRESYQAAKVCVLFDEEPPLDIYSEALTRTASLGTDGIVILNFTPLKGMGPLLVNFLEGKAISTGPISKFRHLTCYTWNDVKHLSEETKEQLILSFPPYMRDARTKGLPVMGEGAVYPISEENVFIDPLPFAFPLHWKRFGALDFGWKDPTVVSWFIINPDGGTVYLYAEHYLSEGVIATHAEAIRAQWRLAGFEIPIVCDPSGGGRSIADGTQTRQMYLRDYKIPMISAQNGIEIGIATVFQAMTNGRFKIYKTCTNALKEFRSYSRFKNGFKGDDHSADTWRYGFLSGLQVAMNKDEWEKKQNPQEEVFNSASWGQDSWMMS